MAARATWSGSVELGGFPVNIALFNRTKSKRGESFKMIAPDGGPVARQWVDSDGNEIEYAECGRGVERGGKLFPLSEDVLEAIGKAERSDSVAPRQFVPKEQIDFALATGAYAVTPDSKVPGADQPVQILWNGLLDTGLAYVTQITFRAGSAESIVALYAEDDGLYAVTLPFEQDVNIAPDVTFERDEKAAAVFGQFVDTAYDEIKGDLDLSLYEDTQRQRRQDVIEQALAGEAIEVPEPAAKPEAADLMSVLEGAVEQAGKGKAKKAKPRKKSTTKKAKVTA